MFYGAVFALLRGILGTPIVRHLLKGSEFRALLWTPLGSGRY